MKRKKCVMCVCVFVFIYYFFGIGDYIFVKNFDEEFNYPLDIELQPVVERVLAGDQPGVAPINRYPYRFLSGSTKCSNFEKIDLVILVKSAIEHFEQRKAIRLTYGRETAVPRKVVKVLFFLGIHRQPDPDVRVRVLRERDAFSDVIQMDFEDSYYNMTIKTMMSFRWASENCPTAGHFLFTDDDMYISVSNLLRYVGTRPGAHAPRHGAGIVVSKADDGHLLAGHVFESAPQRFWTSKWRVSLEEYPWHRWPAYVTAGAYVVSNKTLREIDAASAFVKHFRFDDIYLGIVAKKLDIALTHCENFHFYKKRYSKDGYRDVIASHGYENPRELISVWNEQNTLQNAAA